MSVDSAKDKTFDIVFGEHFWNKEFFFQTRNILKNILKIDPISCQKSRKMLLFSYKKVALKMLITLGADIARHLCSPYCLMLSVVSV